MKQKQVAGILALLFGVFGVHRFYLGQRFLGVVYMFMFFFGMMGTIASDGEAPLILAPAIISFVDAILFFTMPKEDFDRRYNKRYVEEERPMQYGRPSYQRRRKSAPVRQAPRENIYKRRGIQKFRDYDFEGAIDEFEQALEENYEDPALHFNLACCHSILENANYAFQYLEKAVSYGFNDMKKIHSHDALSYLRSLPEFDDFVENNYRRIMPLPHASTPEDILQSKPSEKAVPSDDLLEQIVKLGDLKEKGILTDEEFAEQKKKLLGDD